MVATPSLPAIAAKAPVGGCNAVVSLDRERDVKTVVDGV